MRIIETRLSENDALNANFVLYYRRPLTIIFLIAGSLFLIFSVFYLPVERTVKSPIWYLYPLALFGMVPIMLFFRVKKIYQGNSRLKEKIEYEFQDQQLLIRGESFNSQFSWEKIFKVTETKNWIFIYPRPAQANPIPKKNIWEGEILKLKEILDANRVKHNLK